MRRYRIVAVVIAIAACFEGTRSGPQPRVVLSPLLDSVFVGETRPPYSVTYISAAGDTQPTGPVTWRSQSTSIATVDAAGQVAGVSRGITKIRATANGVTGEALVVVMNTLEVTLLLDTIYLMKGDNFTVPVEVRKQGGDAPVPSFDQSPQSGVFTIDAGGLVTAIDNGGPIPFVVRADTVADTGWVHVVRPIDTATANSRAHYTIFGTVVRRTNGEVVATDYRLRDGSHGFQVTVSVVRQDQTGRLETVENVVFTVPDSFAGPGAFFVDEISREEATRENGVAAVCEPERPWAFWRSVALDPALSRAGGGLAVTQMEPVAGGFVVSGRFRFDAQRMDFYDDPGGLLPIRGTFVAPLVTNLTFCPS